MRHYRFSVAVKSPSFQVVVSVLFSVCLINILQILTENASCKVQKYNIHCNKQSTESSVLLLQLNKIALTKHQEVFLHREVIVMYRRELFLSNCCWFYS